MRVSDEISKKLINNHDIPFKYFNYKTRSTFYCLSKRGGTGTGYETVAVLYDGGHIPKHALPRRQWYNYIPNDTPVIIFDSIEEMDRDMALTEFAG